MGRFRRSKEIDIRFDMRAKTIYMCMEKSPKSSPRVVGEVGFGWGFVGRSLRRSVGLLA